MMTTQQFFEEMKRQSRRGQCLHFDRGEQCSKIIDAHSIQKNGQLSSIAEEGKVYRADFNPDKGGMHFKKVGINKASVFPGFCGTHDNTLFAPIDRHPLQPSFEQIALYAYRCVSREYFVKGAAIRGYKNIIGRTDLNDEFRTYLKSMLVGNSVGFTALDAHKRAYDASLSQGKYTDFRYVTFNTSDEEFMQVSGLLYPTFDFSGRELQELGSVKIPNELITYFTAPTSDGWAFCFAWHASSDRVCKHLMQSLAASCLHGEKLVDALLRFVVWNCENHAFKISWWDNLNPSAQQEILKFMNLAVNPQKEIPSNYLISGCENIVQTEFNTVRTSEYS